MKIRTLTSLLPALAWTLSTSLSGAATTATGVDLGGGTTEYLLDMGGNNPLPVTPGWTYVPLTDSSGTVSGDLVKQTNPEAISLGGDYSLQILGDFGTWQGAASTAQPLTKDGWYYKKNSADPGWNPGGSPTFTISGLTAGQTVSIWATLSWDGTGKAPQMSFGGGGTVNLNTATLEPGTAPAKSDLVLVASGVVATGGTLSGTIDYPSSGNGEGQIGGMIIDVTAVPEPSVMLLGIVGLGGLLTRRRN